MYPCRLSEHRPAIHIKINHCSLSMKHRSAMHVINVCVNSQTCQPFYASSFHCQKIISSHSPLSLSVPYTVGASNQSSPSSALESTASSLKFDVHQFDVNRNHSLDPTGERLGTEFCPDFLLLNFDQLSNEKFTY